MRYPGGKGGAGVYQTIINLIPPHRVYIEAFAGGASIYERKAPAASSILLELDPDQAMKLRSSIAVRNDEGTAGVWCTDALQFLSSYPWAGDEFVYLDPPYVLSTRTKKSIYNHEMTDDQHRDLVSLLSAMGDRGVRFMLSGYRNEIYDDAARVNGWRRVDFNAMTRGGVRVESVWMNYEAPAALADYAYAGQGYRERERIKRKVHRWIQRLEQLPAVERNALLAAMQDMEATRLATTAAVGGGRSRASSGAAELCEVTR